MACLPKIVLTWEDDLWIEVFSCCVWVIFWNEEYEEKRYQTCVCKFLFASFTCMIILFLCVLQLLLFPEKNMIGMRHRQKDVVLKKSRTWEGNRMRRFLGREKDSLLMTMMVIMSELLWGWWLPDWLLGQSFLSSDVFRWWWGWWVWWWSSRVLMRIIKGKESASWSCGVKMMLLKYV